MLRMRIVVATAVLAAALVGAVGTTPAQASAAGERAALAALQASWDSLSLQQKLGTCNAFRRSPALMVKDAADFQWKKPASRKGMTRSGWSRVYRQYFAWACSGAGRSPRP